MKTLKQRLSQKLWFKILGYSLIPLYIVLCYFITEYTNTRNFQAACNMMWGANFVKFCFSLIVLTVISLPVLLLCRKIWVYAIVFGAFCLGMGVVNCLKVAVNGDNFVPWDVIMLGNAGDLVGFAKFDLPPLTYVWLLVAALFCVFFWLTGCDIPLKWYIRLPATLLIVIPVILLYNFPNASAKTLNVFGMTYDDCMLQSRNYKNNGFINAFTINCFALKTESPDGYTEAVINSYLDGYTAKEATESPDIICIMSEAFFDVREINGTEFSIDPLENFDEIKSRENACYGTLFTTAYGGGTVRTEFDFLTGLTVDNLLNGTSPWMSVTSDVETYVSNYRDQGYNTIGIHTFDANFYSRSSAYPYLGFDAYYGLEHIEQSYVLRTRRGFVVDDLFMDVVIDTLKANTDKPNFIYGITMENHGGYSKSGPAEIVVEVKNDLVDEEYFDQITTYTQGVYYADLSLKKLVDYVDSCEKPTVVVYFGDHKPAFGSQNAAFNQTGNVDGSDGYDVDENKFIYSAPYVMYANYDIDYGQLEGENEVSAYYMLSLLAEATGTKMTPFMQLLADKYKSLPYYNVRLGIELEGENKSFIDMLQNITYDRISGKKYSVTQGEGNDQIQ